MKSWARLVALAVERGGAHQPACHQRRRHRGDQQGRHRWRISCGSCGGFPRRRSSSPIGAAGCRFSSSFNRPLREWFKNVYFDTAASSLIFEKNVFRRVVDLIGADRVLFGTDYPLLCYPRESRTPDFSRALADAATAGLTEAELNQVLGGNLRRLLGWLKAPPDCRPDAPPADKMACPIARERGTDAMGEETAPCRRAVPRLTSGALLQPCFVPLPPVHFRSTETGARNRNRPHLRQGFIRLRTDALHPRLLEDHIGEVWVEGEISNFRRQSSGHQYFTLKDDRSQLPCVLFRNTAACSRPRRWRTACRCRFSAP